LLKGLFTTIITDYLFSPRRAMEEHQEERAANRKTPKYASHMSRNAKKRKSNPERAPKEKYDRTSFARAVARACDQAFPPPTPLAKRDKETLAEWDARLNEQQKAQLVKWQQQHRWHPNQLRHSHATKVRKEFGLEAAGAALGHSKMSITEIYAERDAGLATAVAAKLG
jgi:hypothetical protein